jgi:hypothetical protein
VVKQARNFSGLVGASMACTLSIAIVSDGPPASGVRLIVTSAGSSHR